MTTLSKLKQAAAMAFDASIVLPRVYRFADMAVEQLGSLQETEAAKRAQDLLTAIRSEVHDLKSYLKDLTPEAFNEMFDLKDSPTMAEILEKTSGNDLLWFEIGDDTMTPTLKRGETVGIDEESRGGIDGIYGVLKFGILTVRRLQFLPDEKIVIRSDNINYPPLEITRDIPPEQFTILGLARKVVRTEVIG